MTTFVFVHGSRHGGWCWKHTASLLRELGHETYCPTLSGNGDRGHLPDIRAIDLLTHVQDITALLFYEDLRDVILVGHSYGGMVVAGTAEHAADRLARLIFVDAFVPRSGESHSQIAGEHARSMIVEQIKTMGEGVVLPAEGCRPEDYGVVEPALVAWAAPRLSSQPANTYFQPLPSVTKLRTIPRVYIACSQSSLIPEFIRERAREDPGFVYTEVDEPHDVMITNPKLLADRLLSLSL